MRARSAALALMTLMCAHRPKPARVLFLCPHGGAKSVIAATYFNDLAAKRHLAITATAAASDDPYDAVPRAVADALRADGFDVRDFHPHHVTNDDIEGASRVVTIDCEMPSAERWDDVPKVSEDLHGSIAAIRRHVARLVEELVSGKR